MLAGPKPQTKHTKIAPLSDVPSNLPKVLYNQVL